MKPLRRSRKNDTACATSSGVPTRLTGTDSTIARVRGTDEAREGFAAFLGKRPPAWVPKRDET